MYTYEMTKLLRRMTQHFMNINRENYDVTDPFLKNVRSAYTWIKIRISKVFWVNMQ